MIEKDDVLLAISQLPLESPPLDVSRRLRLEAHAKLVPAKVHPAFCVAVAASVVMYLGWALFYTSQLY